MSRVNRSDPWRAVLRACVNSCTAPLSPTPLPVSLLIDLVHQVPQVQYAKIEVPQAADKLHSLVSALGDRLPGPFDGEESVTLIPDLDAGAKGTMPSSMVPAELGQIVRRYLAGDRAGAVRAWEDLLPLIHFENRLCGIRRRVGAWPLHRRPGPRGVVTGPSA